MLPAILAGIWPVRDVWIARMIHCKPQKMMVGKKGLEPLRARHRSLKPGRLPVPTLAHQVSTYATSRPDASPMMIPLDFFSIAGLFMYYEMTS